MILTPAITRMGPCALPRMPCGSFAGKVAAVVAAIAETILPYPVWRKMTHRGRL